MFIVQQPPVKQDTLTCSHIRQQNMMFGIVNITL